MPRITTRLPEKLHRAATRRAAELGVQLGPYVRQLIEQDTGTEPVETKQGFAALSKRRRKMIAKLAADARWKGKE